VDGLIMSALLIRSTADNGFEGHFRLSRFWPRAGQRAVLAALEPGDFEADGLPKLAAVKARLPEGTKGLTKALLVTIWGDLKPTP